jgi:hypothetical protein
MFDAPEIERIITDRLGADGRAALRHATSALSSITRQRRPLAQQIVRTLVLEHLCGHDTALEMNQLWRRMPAAIGLGAAGEAGNSEHERRQLDELAAHSNGAITASPI